MSVALSVRVLPVNDSAQVSAKLVADALEAAGFPARIEPEGTLGARIRAWAGDGADTEPVCAIVATTPRCVPAVNFRTPEVPDAGAVEGRGEAIAWLRGFAAGGRSGGRYRVVP